MGIRYKSAVLRNLRRLMIQVEAELRGRKYGIFVLLGGFMGARAVQRSMHDAHGEDCTDAAEGDAMPTI